MDALNDRHGVWAAAAELRHRGTEVQAPGEGRFTFLLLCEVKHEDSLCAVWSKEHEERVG